MEINNKSLLIDMGTRANRLEVQDQQTQRFQKADREGAVNNPDRVELSVRSREIQHLDGLIRSTPDIREALVEQVRGAIESGTYNVKAEHIADKIVGGNVIDQIF